MTGIGTSAELRQPGRPGALWQVAARMSFPAGNSLVSTKKRLSACGPNEAKRAVSAASRPYAIAILPVRGRLWRASNVYQWLSMQASNQAEKSIGAGSGGTPMSPR